MSPSPAKRRKLDHDLAPVDASIDSDSKVNEVQPFSNVQKAAPALDKPQRSQRAIENEDAALYAGGFYKSSLFKLQVDELLHEVAPNYEKRFSGLTDDLHKLKVLIEEIEERAPLSVS